MTVEPIPGDGVRLRAYRESDADDLAAGCCDPETQRFLPLLPSPYTRADAEWWITVGAPARFTAGAAAYAIVDPDTDRVLGGIALDRLVQARQQAEIGYWVAPWARGRGVATAAVRALSDKAFADGVIRLEVLAVWANVASQRVALAAGFTREGVRRSTSVNRAGVREDLVAFVRVADDPAEAVERLLPDLPGGELTDGVVTLRPLTMAHLDFYGELANSPSVIATSVPPEPKDAAELELRCTRAAGRWLAGERADLVIHDTATGTAVGDIGLFYQEPQTGQAMIGYAVLPEWRGRGYATRAASLVARWAFAETGIKRLIAGTLPDNAGSQRVLQKAGFQREGYLRSRLPGLNGTRVDDVQFALIAGDLPAENRPATDLPTGELSATTAE